MKINAKAELEIKQRFDAMRSELNEKQLRHFAGNEAKTLGYGGVTEIAKVTGLSRKRIGTGCKEIADTTKPPEMKRVREKGGGRKQKLKQHPELWAEIEKCVESSTHGDPCSLLRWCSKSSRKIAAYLQERGYSIQHDTVLKILKDMRYSLQVNKKELSTKQHPDRNAQFEHINSKAKEFIAASQPVISIDTKKKELVGNFKNNGREYALQGKPESVNMYDFESDALLKAVPYGIYDIVKNEGWVNVGISSDTAAFAVESIRRWWNGAGRASYPRATQLMITADGGGSNGYRVGLFKKELQKLANETHLEISVCHFPPGASKWNKIEHRLFSFISNNWRGHPLRDLVTVVNLIGNTRTNTGLKITCEVDNNSYQTGIKISKKEIDSLNIKHDGCHGNWNYTISPQL